MPTYSTPGVYVTESALSSLTPSSVGGTAAAFFGEAARGPLTPVLIQDWNTYKNVFGALENAYDLGYAVYHFFANGGRGCYVRRVLNSVAATATRASVPFYPTGNANASASLFAVSAISAGTWGNSLTVQTLTGTTAPTATVFGSFSLVVLLDGVEVERWSDLTLDPDANRYAPTIVNTYSNFVRLSSVNTTAVPTTTLEYISTTLALAGGTQATVEDSDYVAALTDLDTIQGNLLLNAVGKSSSTVVTAFVAKAATRGDSFVIIDPSATDTTFAELQTTASNFSSISNLGYAAHYTPMLKMVDPAKTGPGAIRTTFPGGALAGLYVRTEVERTVAKAPAGFAADIRGALGLSVILSETQIGTLYDGTPQVNTFKAVPGAGVTVFGARTLNKTTPDKFINVRRTLNYVKYNLKSIAQFAVFEPNDANLWNSINMTVSSFLSELWRSGGLKGARSSDAFYVLCDGSNNTTTSVDNGQVNIEVGVALQYPAEFVVINVSQWTGGSNTAESL